ncbi:MAG: hypothetical protein ACN4GT_09290, partial [Gammaproteobacteria bacterium]
HGRHGRHDVNQHHSSWSHSSGEKPRPLGGAFFVPVPAPHSDLKAFFGRIESQIQLLNFIGILDMKNRLIVALTGLLSPMLALATNGVGVLEMHPYVTGRAFPWAVPLLGTALLVVYIVRTVKAYREAEAIESH